MSPNAKVAIIAYSVIAIGALIALLHIRYLDRSRKMAKIKTTKTVLMTEGKVQLVMLERFDCPKPIFGVSAPYKISGLDGPIVCEQFYDKLEALRMFDRYVTYFKQREGSR